MGILSRVEAFFERFLEAPAGRLGASIQPVSLAKRIERAMDTNKTYRDTGVIVPNHYALHLHPADFAAFASYQGSLEDDLAHGVLAPDTSATRSSRVHGSRSWPTTRPDGARSGWRPT